MAGQIPDETVEEVRKSNDIVDTISEYVQLKRQGRNFVGLCPFHGEKTPSFSVTQDKQIFHCFGCGKGGNVITFLMEIEGYSFYQAIQQLADKSGLQLPEQVQQWQANNNETKENQDILSAYEWLSKLYHHLLRHTKDGKEGYQYFKDRGFTDETINTFQLGFAPNSKDFIVQFLEKKGFHSHTMVKAGLLSSNEESQVSDRFRGRVIFPIRNHQGKTIAFGGRTIQEQEPKYLNSPETELFQKGKMLFNFDLARSHIRKGNEAILFEGYMDVISAYQSGIKNGIATLGTSITEVQSKLLRRYVDNVVICYDSDDAGVHASYKAARALKNAGCNVRVSNMKNGMDPDDYIREFGADRFKSEVIDASDTYMTFVMRYMKKDYNLNVEGDRLQYVESVLDQIALIESPVEREYYLKELAKEFELSLETLAQEIQSRRKRVGYSQDNSYQTSHTTRTKSFNKNEKLLPAFHNAERQLIAYMLKDVSVADKVLEELGGAFNIDEHKVLVTYLYAYYEEGNPPDVGRFIEKLPDANLQSIVVQIAMFPVYQDISDREINDYIRIIQAEHSDKARIKTLAAEQKLAEQQNNPVEAAKIGMQIIDIKKQLKNTN